jgi:hypothetical protein
MVLSTYEELAKEFPRGFLVSAALHENSQYIAVLIHCSPQIVAFAINRKKYLIQVPFVVRSGTPVAQLIRILLAELTSPCPDGFISHQDSTNEQELFDIAIALVPTMGGALLKPCGPDVTGEARCSSPSLINTPHLTPP